MCNACGFQCCASDMFSRCGCDCDEPMCREICSGCGSETDFCCCDEFEDDEHIDEDYLDSGESGE